MFKHVFSSRISSYFTVRDAYVSATLPFGMLSASSLRFCTHVTRQRAEFQCVVHTRHPAVAVVCQAALMFAPCHSPHHLEELLNTRMFSLCLNVYGVLPLFCLCLQRALNVFCVFIFSPVLFRVSCLNTKTLFMEKRLTTLTPRP